MSKAIVNTLESLETGEQFDVRDIAQLSARYQRQKNQIFLELRRLAAEAGFNLVDGSFEEGGVLNDSLDVLWFQGDGKYYAWGGDLPKTVAAGFDPTTNLASNAWIDKTDTALRKDINIVQKRFVCVADMVADTSLIAGQIVETIGYHNGWAATASKPKGGNRHEIVAASTSTDDGGSFITLSNGLQAKALFINGKDFYQFGAHGDGSTDDSTYIQNAINSGGSIIVRDGEYNHDSQITLVSNLKLRFEPNATIKPSNSIAQQAWYAFDVSNIKIVDGNFEHTGTAYTDGNQRILVFSSCDKVTLIDTEISKSRNDGALFDACTRVKLRGCDLHNNYGTGATFRNGCSKIKVTDTDAYSNGDTGVAQAPNGVGGRGLLFWQCSNVAVHGGSIQDNTEYGLRFYSQSGDTQGNRAITITSVKLRNNGTDGYNPIDLYIYDESGLTERIAISTCSFATKGAGAAAVLSGKNITFKGNVGQAISAQTALAMSFYGSTDVLAEGNTFEQYGTAFSLSNSSGHISTRCKIKHNNFKDVAVGLPQFYGVSNEICDNSFTHGGVGTLDTCFTVTSDGTGKIHDNTYLGFYRAMNIATTAAVSIKRNKAKDSTSNGLYALYQTDNTNLVWADNDFDNPYPSFMSTLQKRGLAAFERATFYVNTIPTTSISVGLNVAWKVGDRAVQNTPIVGQPKSWVCTVAGTPGTWVSEGTL